MEGISKHTYTYTHIPSGTDLFTKEPLVSVGILANHTISFSLHGSYLCHGTKVSGDHTVHYTEGQIEWNGRRYDQLAFKASDAQASFSLEDVTIGINFHWERKETQTFAGHLHIIIEDGKLCAINEIQVEEYLKSVISSEMSANSSLELLKAHAVISRSWLLVQMQHRCHPVARQATEAVDNKDMRIKWYDRKDHTLFDVCADDHCQRYQGITRESNPSVVEAIRQTRGQVLTSEQKICDARFSKCCGGMVEEFQYCWEDSPKPYLRVLADNRTPHSFPDLTIEHNAEQWIRSTPESFCNTSDKGILSQVLNGYDQETADFYRWKVEYTQEQLAELISRKTGIDFGQIIDLVPQERGRSGRITLLKIVGTNRSFSLGKELEIRRALSESHLYSSAFIVDRLFTDNNNSIPASFLLTGAGWGHGVGLCQIGAAMMGAQGYAYDSILLHYYPGASITTLYT